MKHLHSFVLLSMLLALTQCGRDSRKLHEKVNPWIGTGGHGHTYPGATSPFGMVQLSPDTRLEGWDGCGGYHDTDSVIYGFSHTHLQGTGVSDYGDILVMPCTQYRTGTTWKDKYKSAFDKSSEHGHAGYYSVELKDHNIRAELTSTPRVGIHRYTLDSPDTVSFIVDLAHRDELVHYSIEPRGNRTLVGHRVSQNWAEEQHVYFAMQFDQDFVWGDQLGTMSQMDTLVDGSLQQEMTMVPVFVADFGPTSELNVHVALSFCDIDGALANLEAEAQGFDFGQHRSQNEARWDEQLGRIQVEGGSKEENTVFFTSLYHATTVPNLASDVDGRYRGTDLKVHQMDPGEGDHYTVFSLWDTYRALHPLLSWLEPQRSRDMMRSMLRMYKDGGQLPVWELAANYTGCMIGYHSVPALVDALSWGVDDWDQELALEAMVQAADSMHLGLDAYADLGFIPSNHEHESVSKTLEYAYDDACIARMARHLGQGSLAGRFSTRAEHWKNLVHPASKFNQPKRQGAWIEGFDPFEVNFNFTEANAWQYHFAAAHDVQGQIAVHGGDSAFLQRLDDMFEAPTQTTGRVQPDITGLIGQYAHGNEPSHHVSYLASYAGDAAATASRAHRICRDFYSNAPDGLCGNEDCGQMSAWYVWSALGMYPVEPGSGQLVLGSPVFSRATVWPQGASQPFTLLANGLSDKAHFIQRAQWSKAPSSPWNSFVSVEDVKAGGTLTLDMGTTPGDSLGVQKIHRPTSSWNSPGFLAVPGLEACRAFQGEQSSFALDHIDAEAVLEFSLDGGQSWSTYKEPVVVRETSDILARASKGEVHSSIIEHQMLQVTHDWAIDLTSPPNNQYSAGGDHALIDGLKGGTDYRTGEWQGFWGETMEATIDLGQVETVRGIEARALQDIKPWIWAPASVSFYASEDGERYQLLCTVASTLAEDDWTLAVQRYTCQQPTTARYIQVKAQPHAAIPDWHLGAGNDRWMFFDEIVLDLAP